MKTLGFATFATALGHCGIAWGEAGITGVQLPEGSGEATLARLRARFPDAEEGAPCDEAQRAITAIAASIAGEHVDLAFIRLDSKGVPDFHQRVYEVARTIPLGDTLTYGEVARRLGAPGAARAVGQALGRNPFAPVVPCHRVLAASGTGGFSGSGGVKTKLELLAIERGGGPGPLPLFDRQERSR